MEPGLVPRALWGLSLPVYRAPLFIQTVDLSQQRPLTPDGHRAPLGDHVHPKPKAPAQPKSKVDEILSSIEGKNYSSEQVDLLKRVFSTMLVVCSSSQKKSVIQLMEIAVNSLK